MCAVERGDRVLHAERAVVVRVVVRKTYDVDRSGFEDLHQLASRAKVEVLRQLLAALRERALEIDDRDVRGLEERADAGEIERPQLLLRHTCGELLVEVRLEVVAERRVTARRDHEPAGSARLGSRGRRVARDRIGDCACRANLSCQWDRPDRDPEPSEERAPLHLAAGYARPSSSTRCIMRAARPRAFPPRSMWSWQPGFEATTTSAPERSIESSLRASCAFAMSGCVRL